MNKKERELRYTITPTQLQTDLLIGSMLGDGMIATNPGHSYYQENHCLQQEEYLQFKADILSNFVASIKHNHNKMPEFIGKHKPKQPPSDDKRMRVVLRSISHPFFTQLEEKWYKRDTGGSHIRDGYGRRVKVIPKDITISPFALAIWYLDDGTHSPSRRVCSFATNAFTSDEVSLLAKKLDELDIRAFMKETTKQPTLTVRTTSYLNFVNLITPYVKNIKCMNHKIDLSSYTAPIKEKFTQDVIDAVLNLRKTTDLSITEIGNVINIGSQNASQILRRYKNSICKKSDMVGVYWRNEMDKWTVSVFCDKSTIHLGSFDSQEIAENIAMKAKQLKERGVSDTLEYKKLSTEITKT